MHEVLRDKPINGAGHHVRAKTNMPIIGILTQPIPSEEHGDHPQWKKEFERIKAQEYNKMKKEDSSFRYDEMFPQEQFIESTHVKYLEAAGARVMPIDYTRPTEELNYMLSQINGLYIPGDSKSLVEEGNIEFTQSIRKMLKWAQLHNEEEGLHFPVFGVGYGSLALVKSQIPNDQAFAPFNARGKL